MGLGASSYELALRHLAQLISAESESTTDV
jgi:3-dehydroquinate dehydratase